MVEEEEEEEEEGETEEPEVTEPRNRIKRFGFSAAFHAPTTPPYRACFADDLHLASITRSFRHWPDPF